MDSRYDGITKVDNTINRLSNIRDRDNFINSLDAILIDIINKFKEEDEIIKDMTLLMSTVGIKLNVYNMQVLIDILRNKIRVSRFAYLGNICNLLDNKYTIKTLKINWIIECNPEYEKTYNVAITFNHTGIIDLVTSLKESCLNISIDLNKPKNVI